MTKVTIAKIIECSRLSKSKLKKLLDWAEVEEIGRKKRIPITDLLSVLGIYNTIKCLRCLPKKDHVKIVNFMYHCTYLMKGYLKEPNTRYVLDLVHELTTEPNSGITERELKTAFDVYDASGPSGCAPFEYIAYCNILLTVRSAIRMIKRDEDDKSIVIADNVNYLISNIRRYYDSPIRYDDNCTKGCKQLTTELFIKVFGERDVTINN